QTGTGKTASFTLPMIDILDSGRAKARLPRSLILTPTRELAAQVAESFDGFSKNHNLSKALLIGGISFNEQDQALNKGVDVLIATPGRLLDHIERVKVMLTDVKILVIDEADRMLDMGFIPDIERITNMLPKIRQTLFYSATLDESMHKIASKFVINPKVIEVARPASTASTVEAFVCHTTPKEKRAALRDLIRQEDVSNAVIFCNRKRDISTVKSSLERHGFSVLAMHGDMTQSARNEALAKFKANEVPLLVASDVAARGIDVQGLSHVFNFDVPMNAEDYVHRIGRTGRAGRSGRAFTLIATKDDRGYLEAVEKLIGKPVDVIELDKGAAPSKTSSKSSSKGSSKDKSSSKDTPDASAEESPNIKSADSKPRRGRKKGNVDGELPMPPDCSGDSFKTTEHTPAFLLG
ncbi:MAG: DEAD/DEAH box helicase, partial [Alphaproteobacteria bacterium]|nr:DEAD/DEAH box helicase [Alphaproteobacteria bacterium]